MEWFADPSAWLGLLTLIVLEIVLGIDNLVFIAILADKLPAHQRDRARQIGLGLALGMRLILLASMSWLVTLTEPLIEIFNKSFSGRDLILFLGGVFLLFKATMELHSRLEGKNHDVHGSQIHAKFWAVVTQIIVLDAVFSLDAVITAVGMVEELTVMMSAVIIAMIIMIIASKALTNFVNKHPTVIILCLGFLLMIGFSLIAEGAGMHIPKGYLYGAIAFSVLIEFFNQFARFNRNRYLAGKMPLRARTAEAVLKILGGKPDPIEVGAEGAHIAEAIAEDNVFDPNERFMIRSVLLLAERPIRSLMTPRPDIIWVDINATSQDLLKILQENPHTRLIVSRHDLDEMVGVIQSRDVLIALLADQPFNLAACASEPLVVPEGTSALKVFETLREHPIPMAVVVDEYGSIEGVVTTSDLLAAIAGERSDTIDLHTKSIKAGDGSWKFDGSLLLDQLEELLDINLPPNTSGFYTLGGLALTELQHLPVPGESFDLQGYRFTILTMDGRRIHQIEVRKIDTSNEFLDDEKIIS
ncbi:MAG: TerC family protein [Pseudomonadota bacterium]